MKSLPVALRLFAFGPTLGQTSGFYGKCSGLALLLVVDPLNNRVPFLHEVQTHTLPIADSLHAGDRCFCKRKEVKPCYQGCLAPPRMGRVKTSGLDDVVTDAVAGSPVYEMTLLQTCLISNVNALSLVKWSSGMDSTAVLFSWHTYQLSSQDIPSSTSAANVVFSKAFC